MKTVMEVPDKDAHIQKVFEAELLTSINDRASYTVSHHEDVTVFTVTATDVVALRATLNAITKQLVVFSKMQSIE